MSPTTLYIFAGLLYLALAAWNVYITRRGEAYMRQCETLSKALDGTAEKLNALRAELVQTSEERDQYRADLANARDRISLLTQARDTADRIAAAANDDLAALRTALDQAKEEMCRQHAALSEANGRSGGLQAALNAANSDLEVLRDERDTLAASLRDAEADLANLRDEREALAASLARAAVPAPAADLLDPITKLLLEYHAMPYRQRSSRARDYAEAILNIVFLPNDYDATPKDPATTPADAPCAD